mmetsp:Transcript_39391/g.113238  ORF Transcript_39391/g.113238 Transcript_39391/m.113238 type:complete len:82 (-) Transcript_39391:920-1165(-)
MMSCGLWLCTGRRIEPLLLMQLPYQKPLQPWGKLHLTALSKHSKMISRLQSLSTQRMKQTPIRCWKIKKAWLLRLLMLQPY